MIKSLWKDPVWSAVIAAAVIGVGGACGTYLLGFWPRMATFGSQVWRLFTTSTAVPNWLLVLLGVATIPTLLLLAAGMWALFAKKTSSQPSWVAYTSDMFFGLRWRWRYTAGSIDGLNTFCPHCDYQVFPYEASAYQMVDRIGFKCDSCQRGLGEFDESILSLKSKVERFIQQKVRNDNWQPGGGV
ncbi:MAG TPA: hypothetical protein VMV97_04725 [Sulfuriferula sp.]|nr:hypothetical protein [Sulfuriferula sp.]